MSSLRTTFLFLRLPVLDTESLNGIQFLSFLINYGLIRRKHLEVVGVFFALLESNVWRGRPHRGTVHDRLRIWAVWYVGHVAGVKEEGKRKQERMSCSDKTNTHLYTTQATPRYPKLISDILLHVRYTTPRF